MKTKTLQRIASMFLLVVFNCLIVFHDKLGYADTVNPCEYMNIAIYKEQQLDVGNDPNFKTIMQRKNQELIRECQQWQIDKLRRMQHEEQDREQYIGYYNQ